MLVFTTEGTSWVSASFEKPRTGGGHCDFGVAETIVASAPSIGVVGSITPLSAARSICRFPGHVRGRPGFWPDRRAPALANVTKSRTQAATFTPGAGAASPVLGADMFDVAVSSYATSTGARDGNLAVELHGSSAAVLSLRYDAKDPVPMPWQASSTAAYLVMGGYNFLFDTIALPTLPIVNLVTTIPQVVALPSQTTGWTGEASFNRFDPSLGTLVEIRLNVGNAVAGTFMAENLGKVPAWVNMAETASMTVAAPGVGAAVTADRVQRRQRGVGTFDGSAGFRRLIRASPDDRRFTPGPWPGPWPQTGTAALNDDADLTAFSGTGTIALPVTTAGTSTVTGPSDLMFD